ncbi:unnamed protein product [Closterium sp. NIES-64]|nr:unnamed protein product [Closterium sp. NIES-64]
MAVDAPPPCAETPGGVASSSGPSSGGESVRSDAADVDAESLPDAPSVAGSDESASELDVRIELAYIMRKYYLPNTAITEIIRLFKSKKWAVSDLEFWDTYRDLEEFEKEFIPGDEAWEAVDLELEGDFGTVTFRYRPVIQVHSAVAIPPHTRMDTRDHGQLVKAAPDERKFSNIRIQAGGAEWYGKLLILFQFTGPDGAKVQWAFVKYYDEVSPPCPVTGCLRLVPTTGEDEYSVIEVDSILALAHIVPSFTHDDMLLVNRFLF